MNNHIMEKTKMKCSGCNNIDRDIIKIIREFSPNEQIFTYFLSCGHKYIECNITEIIRLRDFFESKHKDSRGKLLSKQRTKISGESKRLAREILEIDHEKKTYHHQVEEQNDDGEWEIVHKH